MRIKIPILVVLALLLAGAPAFGDEGRGGLSRFTYNPAGNGYPLVDQSSFQLIDRKTCWFLAIEYLSQM